MKPAQIRVVYLDNSEGEVSNDVLDVLIATGKILRFRREEGWIDVIRDRARLRDYRNGSDYGGPERRSPWPDKR